MAEPFDAIVLGVGAMGSAACRHLARRGGRVLGIDRFRSPHEMGSSHGRSRVIRRAYFEDPRYVPLLERAYRLWEELEATAGRPLLFRCGCLNLGPPDHACIRGARRSAEEHDLPHEVLDAREIRARWTPFEPDEGDVGVYETDAGFLVPEVCLSAHLAAAADYGAVFEWDSPVRKWTPRGGRILVETERNRYETPRLVITAGAWLGSVAAGLGVPFRVERQVQAWFEPVRRAALGWRRMPAFIHFVRDRAYYGIPIHEGPGVKIARHHGGATTTAEDIDRNPSLADLEDLRGYMSRYIPSANGPLADAKICMYTNTPEEHFIIDRHPRHENVLIAGGFSGHGFKFAPVVGEIVADLIVEGGTDHPVELFALRRRPG